MDKNDKICAVLFDEMSLHAGLYYNESEDCVTGKRSSFVFATENILKNKISFWFVFRYLIFKSMNMSLHGTI
jgi:hypothetical protein